MRIRIFSVLWCVLTLSVLPSTGCVSGNFLSTQPGTAISGNWSFTSPASSNGGSALTLNAGFTPGQNGAVSAVAHLSGASCVNPTAGIALRGSVNRANQISLVSEPFGGTTLALKGQVSADGTSISSATWSFSGGSCATLGSAQITATDYTEIGGTYTGTFVDAGGNQLSVSATLTQTSQPDQNGQFHLSGSATFPNNPCFTQSIVTDSLVTGDELSTTYTQGNASITASGTFNSGATQLTVNNWQVTGGPCDGDFGTGMLTEQ